MSIKTSVILLFFISFSAYEAKSIDYDLDEMQSLKIDANHNMNRLKAFGVEAKNNRIYDNEREKALAEYLEEQERWDLIRERGLREYRNTKKQASPRENGPEYLQYLEQIESEQARYENNREKYLNTKKRINQLSMQNMGDLEYQELGLALTRPRYNLRTRSQNKWVNSSNRSSGGSASMSSPPNFYQPPAPPPASDFVPAQQGDFSGNPAPSFETFDEVQPAVPPPVFDSSMEQPAVFDGSAEGMPPPPPPPDFEF